MVSHFLIVCAVVQCERTMTEVGARAPTSHPFQAHWAKIIFQSRSNCLGEDFEMHRDLAARCNAVIDSINIQDKHLAWAMAAGYLCIRSSYFHLVFVKLMEADTVDVI